MKLNYSLIKETDSFFKDYSDEQILEYFIEVLDSFGYEYDLQDDWIIVKFGDCLIKNVYNETHPITDLYFKFPIVGPIEAIRMSASENEIYSDYTHSHINNGLGRWTDRICTGSVVSKYSTLRTNIECFLPLTPIFCRTESTNTSPYKYIRNINSAGGEKRTGLSYKEDRYLQFVINFVDKIKPKYLNNTITFEIIFNEDLINAFFKEKKIVSYYVNGIEYRDQKGIKNLEIPQFQFIFKDEIIQFKVTNRSVIQEPAISEIAKQEYKKQILSKFLNQHESAIIQLGRTINGITE